MIKNLKLIFGLVLYRLLYHVSFKFILPEIFDNLISDLRILSLKLQGAKFGKGCRLRDQVFIAYPKNLVVGDFTTISKLSLIYNYSPVTIGDYCEFGPKLYILTNEHRMSNPNMALTKQGSISNPLFIGDNVYLGYHVTILSKAKINNRVVVGACSMVNSELQSNVVFAGIPARPIKPLN